uniref:Uncharacterized protein n=1 Tax=Anguilla anguilla TaxID=7936 RepID=A0A0E9P616_ANGAN
MFKELGVQFNDCSTSVPKWNAAFASLRTLLNFAGGKYPALWTGCTDRGNVTLCEAN